MDSQQNNITATLGLYDKADDRDREENDMKSDVLPPNNPLGIRQNRVDIEDILLAKDLRPATIPMHFPRRINIDVIGEKSLGNITEDSTKDSQQLNIESVPPDLEQPFTATMPTEIVTPKIKSILPSIFPRQIDVTEENIDRPETATAERVRRRSILDLGRRLFKIGRWLCCWCGAYNPRYDNDDI